MGIIRFPATDRTDRSTTATLGTTVAAATAASGSTADKIQTVDAPAASGDVQIDTNDLKWFGSAAQTAKRVGDELALNHRPVQLSSIDWLETGGLAAAVVARNAAMDWSLNRTAGAAETHVFSCAVPYKIETAGKGAKLAKVIVAYELGVVNATSVDLTCSSTVYAQATNPVVTASHGGAVVDGDYDTNHNTAAKRIDSTVANGEHLMTLTLNTPAYYVTAGGIVRIELVVVLANTGTLKVRLIDPIYSETPQ